jgi:hypothetical protein
MNAVELLQFSLDNAFGILGQVTADLTQTQADWEPPGIANPIGALYWHAVSGTDYVVHEWCMGGTPISQTAGWEEKVIVASDPVQDGDHAATMRSVRIDLPAMHDYTQAVAQATQEWVASLEPKDLERTMTTPIGELNLGQMLQAFVVWHVDAHVGEISALKGCQGAKGYPF